MAFDTRCACGASLVEVVGRRIVLAGRVLMARSTQLVSLEFHFRGMGVVTICATNAFVEHLALNERAIDVIFVHDLTVAVIRVRREKLVAELIVVVIAELKIWADDLSARVTRATGLDLIQLSVGGFSFELFETVTEVSVPK